MPGRHVPKVLREFLETQAAGGIVLLVAAVAALVWVNSPWGASYRSRLEPFGRDANLLAGTRFDRPTGSAGLWKSLHEAARDTRLVRPPAPT